MINYESYRARFKEHKCCVLIPTYNNATAIASVVRDVLQYSDDVCIVNDGSTDNTLLILKLFPSVKLYSYEHNRGKGWALRQGFEYARKQGYDYAITIDSDGQHYAEDLPVFLDALEEDDNAIFIGARNMNQSTVPGKSSFGNKFSNFWFRFETGIDLPDTQSGYRLYPIRKLEKLDFFTVKYEFEVEVIVRAAWSGIHVKSVPVRVYYPPANERITHFRPFQDFSRISVLNTVLVFFTLVWIKPRDLTKYIFQQGLTTIVKDYLIKSDEPAAIKALSVAVGIFFGIAPLWGAQLMLALAIAWLLRLNKGIALLMSNISIPPMIPFILYASYETGRLVVGKTPAGEASIKYPGLQWIYDWMIHAINSLHIKNAALADEIVKNVTQYIIGAFALAFFASIFSGIITFLLVKILKKN
jgi:glycosyltransferase involved in cell wall biosynthesis